MSDKNDAESGRGELIVAGREQTLRDVPMQRGEQLERLELNGDAPFQDAGVYMHEARADLELDWSREAVDPSWTSIRREFLRSMLKDLEIAGEITEVSCRATLCRSELELDTLADFMKLTEGAGDAPTERWINVRVHDDQAIVDVLVRREGAGP